MVEFEGPNLPAKADQIIEAEQNKEYTLLGSMTLKRGHSLYTISTLDFSVERVETKGTAYLDPATGKKAFLRKKVHIEKHKFYIGALNKRNAFRRFVVKFMDRILPESMAMVIYEAHKDNIPPVQWQFDVIDEILGKPKKQ